MNRTVTSETPERYSINIALLPMRVERGVLLVEFVTSLFPFGGAPEHAWISP